MSVTHQSHCTVQNGAKHRQANPIQTRTAGVGLPSAVVAEGGQTPPIQTDQNDTENSRIGSDYDVETATLVDELLSTGYTPSALAVALTVDDDTLRRWRRGIRASHTARKLMRCMLVLRQLAPGLLAVVSTYTPQELARVGETLTVRYLTSDDLGREQRKRIGWRDGAEGGGL